MKTRTEAAFLVLDYKWLSLSMGHFLLEVFHEYLSQQHSKTQLLSSF